MRMINESKQIPCSDKPILFLVIFFHSCKLKKFYKNTQFGKTKEGTVDYLVNISIMKLKLFSELNQNALSSRQTLDKHKET